MIATMPLWQAENARFALQERPFYPFKCVFTKKCRKSYPTHSTHFVWRYKSDRYAAACGQKLLTHIPPTSHPYPTHISPWLRKLRPALSIYWHRRMRMLHRTFLPGTVSIVWCRDSYYQHDSCVHPVLTQSVGTYRGASTSDEQSVDNQ